MLFSESLSNDGRMTGESACFELGCCYTKGKRCIGYKSFIDGYDSVMLHGVLEVFLHSEAELREYFTPTITTSRRSMPERKSSTRRTPATATTRSKQKSKKRWTR